MKSKKTVLVVLAVLFYIFSAINLYKGYDKMHNYNNPDNSYSFDNEYANAYVGGDAYNYIINGTYATAYYALAAGGIIAGTIALGFGFIDGLMCFAIEKFNSKNQYEDGELPPL